MMRRLAIAHGHRLVAEALCLLVEQDFEVVGVVTTAPALRPLLAHRLLDCLLMDLALPGCHGVEFISEVRMLFRALEIIVLTEFSGGRLALRCSAAGASRLVSTHCDIGELRRALRLAPPSDRRGLEPVSACRSSEMVRVSQQRRLTFTRRQQEIFDLLGEGRSCAEISRLLHLARSTVTLHKRSLMRKLGVVEPSSLLRMAVLARSEGGSQQPEPHATPELHRTLTMLSTNRIQSCGTVAELGTMEPKSMRCSLR
jgi:DNA-binding NarL/FixJ family response regulator